MDTSAAVALLTHEPDSARVAAQLAATFEPIASSEWLITEFASALAAKQRARLLRPTHVKAAMEAFGQWADAGLRLLPVSRAAYLRAARLCGDAKTGLRAGDALHLAVAMEAKIPTLLGLDATMNVAARKLGLAVLP
ncbi:MAG: type II toxin-antitoxin system VapC family toxin [Pseudoxanthomonas sp.]